MDEFVTKPIIPVAAALGILAAGTALLLFSVFRQRESVGNKIFAACRVILLGALLFFVNLRPQRREFHTDVQMKNLDVLFVVDTTVSMDARDYNGGNTRMSGVLDTCNAIIDRLTGSSFALIRFDNQSQILAPFTQDATSVKDAFSTLKTADRSYARGSSLNTPYDDMKDLLTSSNEKKGRKTIVFFISDGEITDGSALRSYQALEPLCDAGAVLGFGTESGGKMYNGNALGLDIQDPETGEDAVSRIDEKNLKQIASDLDIDYIHVKQTSDVSFLTDAIRNGSSAVLQTADAVTYEDIYQYFAAAAALLLLGESGLFLRWGRL